MLELLNKQEPEATAVKRLAILELVELRSHRREAMVVD
jgi:hypothetical protein